MSLFGALAAAVLVVGCQRAASPPFTLAFALDGSPPRLLEAEDETAVPLTVTNIGQRAWDPARCISRITGSG